MMLLFDERNFSCEKSWPKFFVCRGRKKGKKYFRILIFFTKLLINQCILEIFQFLAVEPVFNFKF